MVGYGGRLGASAVRYSFTVAGSHDLLLADLTGAPKERDTSGSKLV